MKLNLSPTAVNISVLSFFSVSVIGWFYKLSPLTCCKRALIGAVIGYIAANFGIKLFYLVMTAPGVDVYSVDSGSRKQNKDVER